MALVSIPSVQVLVAFATALYQETHHFLCGNDGHSLLPPAHTGSMPKQDHRNTYRNQTNELSK